MSDDLRVQLQSQLNEVKKQFDQYESQRKGLIAQRNELTSQISAIDRQLNKIVEEQVRLQGDNRALERALGAKEGLGPTPVQKPIPIIPQKASKPSKKKDN